MNQFEDRSLSATIIILDVGFFSQAVLQQTGSALTLLCIEYKLSSSTIWGSIVSCPPLY